METIQIRDPSNNNWNLEEETEHGEAALDCILGLRSDPDEEHVCIFVLFLPNDCILFDCYALRAPLRTQIHSFIGKNGNGLCNTNGTRPTGPYLSI
jgi:hypothetical protein